MGPARPRGVRLRYLIPKVTNERTNEPPRGCLKASAGSGPVLLILILILILNEPNNTSHGQRVSIAAEWVH